MAIGVNKHMVGCDSLKSLLADILFLLGNKFVEWSALLCGYKDTAAEVRKNRLSAWKNRAR